MKKRALITIEVVYDEDKADAESIANALDIILTNSLDLFDDYGYPTFHGFEAGAELPEKD